MADKKGYEQTPMYDDENYWDECCSPVDWPPKDMSDTAQNHRSRIARNKRDENTR